MNLNKRGQGEIFGLSFATIFSIILIVFFIVVAIIASKAFLGWQKCANVGLSMEDLKNEIDVVAWRSENYANAKFSVDFPSEVEYACFVNMSAPALNTGGIDKNIMDKIKYEGYSSGNNFYLFSTRGTGCNKWTNIRHVDLSTRNPICVQVKNGKAIFNIQRKFEDSAVKVSG